MDTKRFGRQTVELLHPPSILSTAAVVGKKEGEGPLRAFFDAIYQDTSFGQKSWEQSESQLQHLALQCVLDKVNMKTEELDLLFGGDLLNQCIATSFAHRDRKIPFCGLYGACSTMAEGLALGAMAVQGGFAARVCAVTSSHFASAERQYRLPLEYGGQRTPTAQWTVTGSGAAILGPHHKPPYLHTITIGKMVDYGVKDAANMGAAMAPAFVDTVLTHLRETGREPQDYDLIISGDLGKVGLDLAQELFQKEGVKLGDVLSDCGALIFERKSQDVHAGGSGCGCSAVVLCGYLMEMLRRKQYHNILFCATGALLSPVSTQQGASIPSICHAVAITNEEVERWSI